MKPRANTRLTGNALPDGLVFAELEPPPGLDPPSRRTWADVVKSKAPIDQGAWSPGKTANSEDIDEETRASSMNSDSELSDCETLCTKKSSDLNADAPSFAPEMNCDAAPFVPGAFNLLDVEAHTRLRSSASLFVPGAMVSPSPCYTSSIPAPPPGLRTDLNGQAKAFVPRLMGSW